MVKRKTPAIQALSKISSGGVSCIFDEGNRSEGVEQEHGHETITLTSAAP